MRILVAVLLIGGASEAVAKSNKPFINAPACFSNLVKKVEFASSTSDCLKFAAGIASRDADVTPMVYRFIYELAPVELQSFFDFHECVHHRVG